MSFFITNGLGDNTLLTNGLGGATVIIIDPDIERKALERTQGSGVGLYHKKRVKGIKLYDERQTLMLKPLELSHLSITEILTFLKLDKSYSNLIRGLLKKMKDSPTKIDMMVFNTSNNKLMTKQHFMHKLDGSTTVKGGKFMTFIEKQITIIDKRMDKTEDKTKHINMRNTISDIEAVELMDIIKDMEDVEDV
jgi:hypothetical protein